MTPIQIGTASGVIIQFIGEVMATTPNQQERRHFTRVEFHAQARVDQGDAHFIANIIDLSLKGILLETPETYELVTSKPVIISIQLAEDTVIIMQSVLAHSSHKFLGFRVIGIDMDSICHLRKLIELNMNDPTAHERVLEELVASSQ